MIINFLSRGSVLLCMSILLHGCDATEDATPQPRPAQVWTVGNTSSSHEMLQYAGTTTARFETDVSFRIDGRLIQRYVDVGDPVKVGQAIARLDNNDLELNISNVSANLLAAQGNLQSNQSAWRAAQAQQQAAQANLDSTLAELNNADIEYRRTLDLFQQDYLSQATLDKDQNRYQTALARVKAARAQIRTAQANANAANAQIQSAQAQIDSVNSQMSLAQNQSNYTVLKSKANGVITQVNADDGEMVGAGQTIVSIAEQGDREIEIRVGENAIQQLKIGDETVITLWSEPGKEYRGKIREVSPTADNNKTWAVKITLLNAPKNLKLGLTAEVKLKLKATTSGHWLPATALYQYKSKPAVWILQRDGTAALQMLHSVTYHDDGIIVTGLKRGRQVIVAGVHTLHLGQHLSAIPYDGAATPSVQAF